MKAIARPGWSLTIQIVALRSRRQRGGTGARHENAIVRRRPPAPLRLRDCDSQALPALTAALVELRDGLEVGPGPLPLVPDCLLAAPVELKVIPFAWRTPRRGCLRPFRSPFRAGSSPRLLIASRSGIVVDGPKGGVGLHNARLHGQRAREAGASVTCRPTSCCYRRGIIANELQQLRRELPPVLEMDAVAELKRFGGHLVPLLVAPRRLDEPGAGNLLLDPLARSAQVPEVERAAVKRRHVGTSIAASASADAGYRSQPGPHASIVSANFSGSIARRRSRLDGFFSSVSCSSGSSATPAMP